MNTASVECPPPPPPAPGQGPAPAEPPPPPKAAAMPCMGDGCRPTCGDIAARWRMFKSVLRPVAVEGLAVRVFPGQANGCADPRLINPGPEGETCPAPPTHGWTNGPRGESCRVEQCQKRQWIMMPTQDGKFACVAPDFQGVRRSEVRSLQQSPRAMPGPDDCTGPTPISSRPGPLPSPTPADRGLDSRSRPGLDSPRR